MSCCAAQYRGKCSKEHRPNPRSLHENQPPRNEVVQKEQAADVQLDIAALLLGLKQVKGSATEHNLVETRVHSECFFAKSLNRLSSRNSGSSFRLDVALGLPGVFLCRVNGKRVTVKKLYCSESVCLLTTQTLSETKQAQSNPTQNCPIVNMSPPTLRASMESLVPDAEPQSWSFTNKNLRS